MSISHWCKSSWGRALGWGLLVFAAISLAEFALIVVAGGDWVHRGVKITGPTVHLRAAAFCLFGWYLLRHGLHQGRREWARFTGKLILLGISTLVGLLAAEIGLRSYLMAMQNSQSLENAEAIAAKLKTKTIQSSHPLAAIIRKSRDPLLVYELRPKLDMDFGHTILRTNSRGMRTDREYTEEKATNCVRIAGIGDSGIFGWCVNQGQDYISVLESNLNAHSSGRLYEALNFGVPGYNSQLEVRMLKTRGLAFHPDVVVVGWCDNDFSLPFFIPQEGQWFRKDISFLYYLLFNRKLLPDVAVSTLNDQRQYDNSRIPEILRQGTDVEGVRRSFLELMALGKEHHFNVLIMGPMGKEPVALFKEIGIAFYNTHDRIEASKYPESYNIYHMHPAAEGHRVLAETLEADLKQRGWL